MVDTTETWPELTRLPILTSLGGKNACRTIGIEWYGVVCRRLPEWMPRDTRDR